MRVLHIYPVNDPMIAQYVSILSKDASMEVESTNDPKMLKEYCMEKHPNIVHQHGFSSEKMMNASLWARRQGIRIVLTPHGQLEPWESDASPLKMKKQRQLVDHAYSMISRGPMETKTLQEQWDNPRIETVANPIITRTITNEDFLAAHRRIYKRVMDSNVLELMDEATIKAFRTLLKAGITGDERWVKPLGDEPIDWHRLFIYAKHENVSNYIDRGLLALGIKVADRSVAPCYLPNDYKKPESMSAYSINDIVRNIYGQYKKRQLSILSLAELDAALRRNDVEDDLLMQQLRSERLSKFFALLICVLSKHTGLDEGFMPCTPGNEEDAKQIENIIKKHLEI